MGLGYELWGETMGVDPQGIDLWIFGSTMIGKCGKYLWEYDGYNGHDLGIYILSERERERFISIAILCIL